MSWASKVVVVTGGSAGLGLEIAKTFERAGAKIVILGRDETRLQAGLQSLSSDAVSIQADMTDENDVRLATTKIVERFGRIDVWVNNVGVSSRGAALETTLAEFQTALEVNFYSAVHGAQAAAPHLKASGGSLVFIGSLASKTASRHLAAYPVAKFAVAAYAHQLRLELKADGVHVLLVCPGPIQRNDSGNRYEQEAENLPDAARKPGGGARVKTLDPKFVAQRILAACKSRKPELVLPGKAKWLFAISQISPQLGDWILGRATDS